MQHPEPKSEAPPHSKAIKPRPWCRHPTRYDSSSNVLRTSSTALPVLISWSSPILVTDSSRSPDPTRHDFKVKYEVFADISRVLCRLWSPNQRPSVPYPGVLPDGWAWENSASWTAPGFLDGSLGRFDFSYIPQCIPGRHLLHWAFVEVSTSPKYPRELKQNPVNFWDAPASAGNRGCFRAVCIAELLDLWDAARDAVQRLPPPASGFAMQARHPCRIPEWTTLHRTSVQLALIQSTTWEQAIQYLAVLQRAIEDSRAYLVFRKTVDNLEYASTKKSDGSRANYLGCWGNDLDDDAIVFLLERRIPVYFIERISRHSRIPSSLTVYQDVSSLKLEGHDVSNTIIDSVGFAPGSSCKPLPASDAAWLSATRPTASKTKECAENVAECRTSTHRQEVTSDDRTWGSKESTWGMPVQWGTSNKAWGCPDLFPWGQVEDPTCDWANMDVVSSNANRGLTPPLDLSLPLTAIRPSEMLQERKLRQSEKRRNKRQKKAGLAAKPDDDLEPLLNTQGKWENFKQCTCDDITAKHMFHVGKAPKEDYAVFYDLLQKRRIYIYDVTVRNTLFDIVAPKRHSLPRAVNYDDSDDDMNNHPSLDYDILGRDTHTGFTLQKLDFWAYGHKSKVRPSTHIWRKDQRPRHDPPHSEGRVPGHSTEGLAVPSTSEQASSAEQNNPAGRITLWDAPMAASIEMVDHAVRTATIPVHSRPSQLDLQPATTPVVSTVAPPPDAPPHLGPQTEDAVMDDPHHDFPSTAAGLLSDLQDDGGPVRLQSLPSDAPNHSAKVVPKTPEHPALQGDVIMEDPDERLPQSPPAAARLVSDSGDDDCLVRLKSPLSEVPDLAAQPVPKIPEDPAAQGGNTIGSSHILFSPPKGQSHGLLQSDDHSSVPGPKWGTRRQRRAARSPIKLVYDDQIPAHLRPRAKHNVERSIPEQMFYLRQCREENIARHKSQLAKSLTKGNDLVAAECRKKIAAEESGLRKRMKTLEAQLLLADCKDGAGASTDTQHS